MAGSLGKTDITGNDRGIDLAGEVTLDLLGYLHGQIGAAVIHSQQHAFQFQRGIEGAFDDADGVHQIAETFQSEVFALHRNQHAVRGAQAVQRQQLQRGRAVDQYVIVPRGQLLQGIPQDELPVGHADHFDARAGKILAGGENIGVSGGDDPLFRLDAVDQHIVDAQRKTFVDAHAGGRVGLGIKVAQQDPAALFLQGGSQVDAGGGFSYAAFLIHDCNNFCHRDTSGDLTMILEIFIQTKYNTTISVFNRNE